MKPTKEYNGRSRIRMFNCDCMDLMEDCDKYDLDICELDTDYFNDLVKRFESHISQAQLF